MARQFIECFTAKHMSELKGAPRALIFPENYHKHFLLTLCRLRCTVKVVDKPTDAYTWHGFLGEWKINCGYPIFFGTG